MVSSEP